MQNIRIKLENDNNKRFQLTSMPCRIKYTGEANVNDYFTPLVVKEGSAVTSSFRGRPLNGQIIRLPEGFNCGSLSKATDKSYTISSGCKEMTYYLWDEKPNKEDPIPFAFQWLGIAKSIHKD